jgi:hypothetical protein
MTKRTIPELNGHHRIRKITLASIVSNLCFRSRRAPKLVDKEPETKTRITLPFPDHSPNGAAGARAFERLFLVKFHRPRNDE